MKRKIFNATEMYEESMPLFHTRDFCGYFQSIATYENNGKEYYVWQFYLAGFTNDNMCRIMRWDCTYEFIPIDQLGHIVINGKIYDRVYWDH